MEPKANPPLHHSMHNVRVPPLQGQQNNLHTKRSIQNRERTIHSFHELLSPIPRRKNSQNKSSNPKKIKAQTSLSKAILFTFHSREVMEKHHKRRIKPESMTKTSINEGLNIAEC